MVLLAPVVGTAYLVYLIVSGIDGLFPDALRPQAVRPSDAGSGRAQRAACWRCSSASSRTTSSAVAWSRFFDRSFSARAAVRRHLRPHQAGVRVGVRAGRRELQSRGLDRISAPGHLRHRLRDLQPRARSCRATARSWSASSSPRRPTRPRGSICSSRRKLVRELDMPVAAGLQAGHHDGHRQRARALDDDRKVATKRLGDQALSCVSESTGNRTGLRKSESGPMKYPAITVFQGRNATCVRWVACVR